jgi:hypothetical protein
MAAKKDIFYDNIILKDFIKSFPAESVSLFETLISVIKVKEDGGCNNDFKRQEVN